jgi:hypothetical protein
MPPLHRLVGFHNILGCGLDWARPSASASSYPAATKRSGPTPRDRVLRLLERLREMGPAPAADLMEYGRSLRSFRE